MLSRYVLCSVVPLHQFPHIRQIRYNSKIATDILHTEIWLKDLKRFGRSGASLFRLMEPGTSTDLLEIKLNGL